MPSITVVVPTCNRACYLRYALMTCVSQEYPHLTILVSNNASEDDTEEVVESFNDSRINYIRTENRLGMATHWEFALQHVNSEYVMFIGDDDALLGFTIDALLAIIRVYRPDAIRWKKNAYNWPDHPVSTSRNILKVRFGNQVKQCSALDSLSRVAAGTLWYGELPGIYHSCVKTQALRNIASFTDGLVFRHSMPDVWTCLMLGGFLTQYIDLKLPLTLPGASGKSNGANSIFSEKSEYFFDKFNAESRASNKNILCNNPTIFIDLLILDVLVEAKYFLEKFNTVIKIKSFNFFSSLIFKEIADESRIAILVSDIEKRVRPTLLHRLRIAYLKRLAIRSYIEKGNINQLKFGLNGSTLILDSMKLGIQDVASASEICTRLLDGDYRSMLSSLVTQ